MRNLTLSLATIALLGSASFAVAQNQLETTLDLAIRGIMDDGTSVSYDERIIGADGSVEYIDLVISAPNEEMVITIDWIKGVPSPSDPETVTFTVSDQVLFSGIEGGVPFNLEMQSSGFELTTNALLREAMSDTDIAVTFSADSLTVKGGEPDSPALRDLFADLGAVDFNFLFSEANMYAEGRFDIEKIDMSYDFTMDEQTQIADQTSGAVSVVFNFDVPTDEDDAMGYIDGSKSAMLKIVAGGGSGTSTIEDDGINLDISGTYEGQESFFEMVGGVFTFEGTAGAIDYTVTPGAGMPFPPVDVSLASTAVKVVIPAGAADAPEEFELSLQLVDLVVGEGVWSMIDPDKTISRDPAQIDIDIEALVEFDAAVAAAGGDPMQMGKIHNLDVNQILLSIAGASIQADGAMTFDNSSSFPVPLGGIIIELNGLTTLANQLVDLGILDQMQAGMAMGMMMAFGKPGSADDQFISEIEFSENGITANGQALR